jgi:HSP20 family molecular chaperone IbpA
MRKLAVRENWFEDLFDFRRGFEQMFNRLLTGWPDTEREATFGLVPQIEAWIDKETKKYHLRMALPGVDPNKVDLKLQGNMLTISAGSKAQAVKPRRSTICIGRSATAPSSAR